MAVNISRIKRESHRWAGDFIPDGMLSPPRNAERAADEYGKLKFAPAQAPKALPKEANAGKWLECAQGVTPLSYP